MAAEFPELQQFIEIYQTCVCFNLRRSARAVTQYFDTLFQAHDLKATQFSILSALVLAELKEIPATITLLAESLVMDRSALARNLKPLEKKGLVTVQPGQDRRTRIVCMTALGHERLNQVMMLWEEGNDYFKKAVGESEVGELLRHSKAIVETTRTNEQKSIGSGA